jgi:UDP-N-acetyl-D-mannosaminuronate dehydrogenase
MFYVPSEPMLFEKLASMFRRLRLTSSRPAKISKHLRRGQLVVLESTTYPVTTDELLRPIMEESGMRVGQDFNLAYSPEREDPGNATFSTRTIPKVGSGFDEVSGKLTGPPAGAASTPASSSWTVK